MTKWDLKKVYVPLEYQFVEDKPKGYTLNPFVGEQSEIWWEIALTESVKGWELVSSVPLISSYIRDLNKGQAWQYTSGYILLFKRPL